MAAADKDSNGAAGAHLSRAKANRRPAPPAETERRRAWGRKWGAMVSQATSELRKG